METQQWSHPVTDEEIEGVDHEGGSWGDYPLDDMLIRHENRTIHDVLRRVEHNTFVMDPDFQRDFIWPDDKQSKLIESVIMRIPLPVFYMAENDDGRMVVVDGLQRLSTFQRFVNNKLALRLPDRSELNGKRFLDLSSKLQNRVEDCNLIFYIIDSKAPEQARLDIFERVNSGEPLTRQQMRNSLFMGPATRFLKAEAQTEIFINATGESLNRKKMRDREFVNRFCAFRLIPLSEYNGDMDKFLAQCLRQMNRMPEADLQGLSQSFRRGMENNHELFGRHAFRKHAADQDRRGVLNASLWDVMATGLSHYTADQIDSSRTDIRFAFYDLLEDENFNDAITYGTSDTRKVRYRFEVTRKALEDVVGAYTD